MKLVINLTITLLVISMSLQSKVELQKSLLTQRVEDSKKPKEYKVLAYSSTVKNRPMENFDYKIITLAGLEAVFYESKIPQLAVQEDSTNCNKNYLFTQLYYQIQLYCQDKTQLCNVQDYVNTMVKLYPEIDWALPKQIEDSFGREKANHNCLVITSDSFTKFADNLFICHLDLAIVEEIKMKLSEKVFETYNKNTDFFVDYIQNNDPRGKTTGMLRLDTDTMKFINLENKKIMLEMPYLKIVQFPFTYYNKEDLPFPDNQADKYQERCIKIGHTTTEKNVDVKIFCVFHSPGDYTKKEILVNYRSRWMAQYYVNKINKRLLPIFVQNSIEKLSLIKDSIEVESKVLIPIGLDVRSKYLRKSYNQMQKMKLDINLSKSFSLEAFLKKTLDDIIKETCTGIPICISAIYYKIEQEMLNLDKKCRLAMSMENPYLSRYPNRNLKIDLVKNGLAKTIVQQVSRMNGKENFFTEEVELPLAGVPDNKAIKKAIKRFRDMRNGNKKYDNVADFKNCNSSSKGLGYLLGKKLALVNLITSSSSDFLLGYLGDMEEIFK